MKFLNSLGGKILIDIAGLFILSFVIVSASPTQDTGKFQTLTTNVKTIQTTGDIINPIYYSGEPLDFDPDSFLRDFNYGKVSQLSDGTTLREFTLIAEDDKTMEISPGIFFNVWTYNGTVPGPTIRVTEGDLVRIKFINNGEKSHTVHFHGTHPAEMDGVFENVGSGGEFTYEFVAGPAGLVHF